jgi:putative monooxygenase
MSIIQLRQRTFECCSLALVWQMRAVRAHRSGTGPIVAANIQINCGVKHSMAISICDKVAPYELDEGVDFKDFVGNHNGAQAISTGIAIFRPSAGLPLHVHNCEESVTILDGDGICDIGGELIPLKPFDTSFVPPRVPHRFYNASSEKTLTILWAYPSVNVDRLVIEENNVDPSSLCKSHKHPKTPIDLDNLR